MTVSARDEQLAGRRHEQATWIQTVPPARARRIVLPVRNDRESAVGADPHHPIKSVVGDKEIPIRADRDTLGERRQCPAPAVTIGPEHRRDEARAVDLADGVVGLGKDDAAFVVYHELPPGEVEPRQTDRAITAARIVPKECERGASSDRLDVALR